MHCNHCFFHVAGLLVAFAYDDISYKKLATQSHTPKEDKAAAVKASNAVDRNTATCMKTLPIGTNSPEQTVWWKVDLGGVYSIHSINILFKNYNGDETRQRGRFAGFSLYVSNSGDIEGSILCYKDEPELPPLNFTIACAESGRYVIFYNERIYGGTYPTGYELQNVYTELCEVIVQGCNNSSFYGSKCDIPCPTNCKDSSCHIQSGTCFTCKPGWTDIHCNKTCIERWYGFNCSQQCVGHCRDGSTCNHVTGQCDTGCAAGWTGIMCNNECDDGTYGYNCVNKCSGHCLNDSPCNKTNGHCDKGCHPGYTNGDCSKECPPGHYGLKCSKQCSSYCINNTKCDLISGECINGCQDGYVGSHCNNSCDEGYFGTNCSRSCLSKCKLPDTCRPTDGSCICAAGSKADNYTIGRTDNVLMKQDISSCTFLVIVLSISILINFILIGCGILLCRRINSNRVNMSCGPVSCWKKSVYQDIVVKTDAASTYQELDLSDSAYQNTTIQRQT